MDNQELQRIPENTEVARPAPDVGDMLRTVVEKGITTENVAAFEKLVGLYERMESRKAEQHYSAAFVALQSDMPKVNATKTVPDKQGGVRYKFAPLEEIIRQIGPSLKQHGFTFSFSERFENGRMIETCTITHVGGHHRSNEFSVRVGSGPPGCNETQADGAAGQYARRYALCDALGIVIEHIDQDARAEGACITKAQADELARRVNETETDRAAFLKFAGAASFTEISSVKYDMLDQLLSKKERRGK
jgi:hypothetical protein